MNEITLTSNEFKVLSSNTRVQIVKLLNARNYTLTELSKKLNLASPTIKQHLDLLMKSNLIEQRDEGRKWKYYALTRKGKKLLEPEETHVMILLSISSIALIAVLILFIGSMGGYSFSSIQSFSVSMNESKALNQVTAPTDTPLIPATETIGEKVREGTLEEAKEPIIIYKTLGIDLNTALIYILLIVVLALIAGFFTGKAVNQRRKRKF